jgi:hypothetical protein
LRHGDKSRMKKIALIIFVVTVISLQAIFAQQISDKCVIRGWVQDKEPRKSISLYKLADPNYVATHNDGIVGNLDNSTERGEEKPVEIIGYNAVAADWKLLRIRKATDLSGKVLFDGDGWIESERVTAKVSTADKQAAVMYSQPRSTSRKVGTIPDQTSLTIIGFDCFGLKVKYNGRSGWLETKNICGDPQGHCQ